MPTLTIKKMPDVLYERLKERAARHRRSMNGEAIALLEQALLPAPRDADALIREADALNRRLSTSLPDLIGEAKRTGRA